MTLGDISDKPSPWIDLALTLPLFLVYQIGVVFLSGIKNATDLVTPWMLALTRGDRTLYVAVTLGIGAIFSVAFYIAGRGKRVVRGKFVQVMVEGALFAFCMRLFGVLVVRELYGAGIRRKSSGLLADIVLSCGAGFYEEIAFRVLLYGAGLAVISRIALGKTARASAAPVAGWKGAGLALLWCLLCAALFSGVHYIGPFGDPLELVSFTYRVVLGVVLTLVFSTRGFATAVWTHALYDLWVVVAR